MINSNIPTGEIAYTLGFTDASHFSRVFKKFVGQTPKTVPTSTGSSCS
ncbi:AraC family transcriptional regulator|uniref:AraC family transcriptional regulator n=3 Tax=Leuconostoc lactis TaxID=1246 RepID=A0A6L7ABM4_LEULA|nr:AraC family transcriptional regulator [Leuconostoc lactis]